LRSQRDIRLAPSRYDLAPHLMSGNRLQSNSQALFRSRLQIDRLCATDVCSRWIESGRVSQPVDIAESLHSRARPHVIAAGRETEHPKLTCFVRLCAVARSHLMAAVHDDALKQLNESKRHASASLVDHRSLDDALAGKAEDNGIGLPFTGRCDALQCAIAAQVSRFLAR
jgi:hypothetical protein